MSRERVADEIPPAVLLVHGQLCGADLIVVRIDVKGSVLPPLIIFQDTDWLSDEFRQIITEERARMPPTIQVDFSMDKDGQSVLYKCFGPNGYCVNRDIQACIILPLDLDFNIADPEAEDKVIRRNSLLDLLKLQTILTDAKSEKKISCRCGKEESNMMILCDSTKCVFGWYHMECVGLEDDFKSEEWYCDRCPENDRAKTTYDNGCFDEDTYQASDERIQLARTMDKVWKRYSQPRTKILKVVQEIEENLDWEAMITVQRLEQEEDNKMLQCRKILT
jgi:hypothetical protein